MISHLQISYYAVSRKMLSYSDFCTSMLFFVGNPACPAGKTGDLSQAWDKYCCRQPLCCLQVPFLLLNWLSQVYRLFSMNRLNSEVLSIIAEQVSTVQAVVVLDLGNFNFLDEPQIHELEFASQWTLVILDVQRFLATWTPSLCHSSWWAMIMLYLIKLFSAQFYDRETKGNSTVSINYSNLKTT